jgi:hypothetical protein
MAMQSGRLRRCRVNPNGTFDISPISIMMLFMRTTLNINDGLLEELRELARSEKLPMTKVVERTLRRGLSKGSAVGSGYQPQMSTYEVGIKPAYQGMSMNQLYDQLESETILGVTEE